MRFYKTIKPVLATTGAIAAIAPKDLDINDPGE